MTGNPVKKDVGPAYVPKEEKPTATISTDIAYDNVLILPQTPQLIALMTYVPHEQHELPRSCPTAGYCAVTL